MEGEEKKIHPSPSTLHPPPSTLHPISEVQMKHTPGPWNAFGFHVTNSNYRLIADCNSRNPTDQDFNDEKQIKEDKANAKLTAAAPDLLEACIGLLVYLDENGDDSADAPRYQQAQQAITKATGENP